MTCQICITKEQQGWIGETNLSHCKSCHAAWRGTATAHCKKCHRTFSSNSACDLAHSTRRDADGELRRVCHDPSTKDSLVETKNEFNTVVYKGIPMSDAAKGAFHK